MLRVAAVVAVLQGIATVVLGGVEGLAVDSERALMGVTTALFFAAYGALLIVCGVALWRPVTWARGPVLFGQLIWLPVAWSLRSGSTTWIAVLLAGSAVLCLGCLLNPAAIGAIERRRYDDPDDPDDPTAGA